MRESGCYFFLSYVKKVGVRYPPLQKVGVRVSPVPPVSYAYADAVDVEQQNIAIQYAGRVSS